MDISEIKEPRHKRLTVRLIGIKTFVIAGLIAFVLGISISFFFSKTIEKFFWEIRARSTIDAVENLNQRLQKTDINEWQNTSSRKNLEDFTNELKQNLPHVAAVKIFTTEGVLAWTDLHDVSPGYRELGIESELDEVKNSAHTIMSAGEMTKQELGKTDLLEIWTIIKDQRGETLGFIEFYFDSSDIVAFIKQTKYSIWISIIFMVGTILFLLRLMFRQQNDVIVRQAHTLADIVEKSPVGICMIDPIGTILSTNSKMAGFVDEQTPEKMLGQNIFHIKNIQNINIEKEVRESFTGKSMDKEIHTFNKNGSDRYLHYQGVPIFKEDDKTVEQVLFMVGDITEQKKLEKELSLRAESLEEHVADRTKELQNKLDELERFERLTVGREIRMTELKQEIEKMRAKLESLGVDTSAL